MNKLKIVTWNRKLDEFHIDDLKDAMDQGVGTYLEEYKDDWLFIGIFENSREAMKYTEHLQEKRRTMRGSQRE